MKKITLYIIALFASLAACGMALAGPSSIQFPPATWYQPAERFPAVKAAGVKTIVGYAATVDLDAWCAGLRANGLTAWCQYTAQTAAYFAAHPENAKLLLGWIAIPDEPNGGGNTPPGAMADEVRSIHAAFPGSKVLVNLDGRPLRYPALSNITLWAACGADVLAFDFYPINCNDSLDTTVPKIGEILDALRAAAPGVPILVCLEDCDQDLKASDWGKAVTAAGNVMRGPSLLEVVNESSLAVAHGAAGVVWFEQVIGSGWESFYDPSKFAPGVIAAMHQINTGLMPSSLPILTPTIPTTQPTDPLDGTDATIGGRRYTLHGKP